MHISSLPLSRCCQHSSPPLIRYRRFPLGRLLKKKQPGLKGTIPRRPQTLSPAHTHERVALYSYRAGLPIGSSFLSIPLYTPSKLSFTPCFVLLPSLAASWKRRAFPFRYKICPSRQEKILCFSASCFFVFSQHNHPQLSHDKLPSESRTCLHREGQEKGGKDVGEMGGRHCRRRRGRPSCHFLCPPLSSSFPPSSIRDQLRESL